MAYNQRLFAFALSNMNGDAQQVVDTANVPYTTYNIIPLADLEDFLNTVGLKRQIKTIIDDVNAPLELRQGLEDFLEHISSTRTFNLNVTDPKVRAKFEQCLAALKTVLPDQVSNLDIIRAMGIDERPVAIRETGAPLTVDLLTDARQRVTLMSQLNTLKLAAEARVITDETAAPASLSDIVTPLLPANP